MKPNISFTIYPLHQNIWQYLFAFVSGKSLYAGFISDSRSVYTLKKNLTIELENTLLNHPEELPMFQ
jgi:hypothetical protein